MFSLEKALALLTLSQNDYPVDPHLLEAAEAYVELHSKIVKARESLADLRSAINHDSMYAKSADFRSAAHVYTKCIDELMKEMNK